MISFNNKLPARHRTGSVLGVQKECGSLCVVMAVKKVKDVGVVETNKEKKNSDLNYIRNNFSSI